MHPTQVFLHNPCALRVEYRLDDQRLTLWWSPGAGESFDAVERNYSNRDDHLEVFDAIHIPGCDKESFERCDYDPYHVVLHFKEQVLHLAVAVDEAILLLWGEKPQRVTFKTHRHDLAIEESETSFVVSHKEPTHHFEFAARTTRPGQFRHSYFHGPHASRYAEAVLGPGVPLAIGVGLVGSGIGARLGRNLYPGSILEAANAALNDSCAQGRVHMPDHPGLESLRDKMVRGLHSMIDDSGAMRASIKAIYYLIWVRDAGFCFPYQAAAGWTHRLPELCQLLLTNPTTARGDGIPGGRMFAQLVNKDYGKYEEDGIFYVLWVVFTHWTQTGDAAFVSDENLSLLDEAMDWVERYIFDRERGLFGQHFADETPAVGARDDEWDYAIGKPGKSERPTFDGIPISRFYDTYINVLMHSAWTMLAAITDGDKSDTYTAKATALWKKIKPFFDTRTNGLPQYGELLLADGRRVVCPPWKLECTTVYVWALSIPSFVPVDDWDDIRAGLLKHIMAQPTLFWINGLCSTIASVDPICHREADLLAALEMIRSEAETPGPFLPMGGAMPEKLGAPQGNLYHDIRPQGFAMGAFLGALTSLGIRRLPHGLAVRPTAAIAGIESYPWRGKSLRFEFAGATTHPALEINGQRIPGTLQIPEDTLNNIEPMVRTVDGGDGLLLVRSTIRLESVTECDEFVIYTGVAYGLSEMTFSRSPTTILTNASGSPIPHSLSEGSGLHHLRFTFKGSFVARMEG